jgi:NTP pyrophosphatase (non-canonical NTP hydrolase)
MIMIMLSNEENGRLVLLIEECGEVIQAATKVMRFGYDSWKNRDDLETEIGHVKAAVELMLEKGDLDEDGIKYSCETKRVTRFPYQ